MRAISVVAGLGLVAAACITYVRRDGFLLDDGDTNEALRAVANRASFELDCPRDQLRMRVLNAMSGSNNMYANQIGVEGCGHRAVYVRATWGAGWTVNTAAPIAVRQSP